MAPYNTADYTQDLAPLEIFCSYSHEDDSYRQELERHLSVLSWQGKATLSHDRRITPGTNWAEAIDSYLETASIILLLISSDFLASQYCYGIEMQRALERHEAGVARVIPIIVRACDWQTTPFAMLQALPTDGKPITTWPDRDTAWTEVVKGIRRVLDEGPLSGVVATAQNAGQLRIWNIPFARNPFFTGRDELLERLHTQLQTTQTAAVSQPQAISGLGGIGKTQVAVEYAYRYAGEYQVVLWARANSVEELNASYTEIARLLNLSQKDEQKQEVIVQVIKNWLSNKQDWLLILDNADELTILPPFLPTKFVGHLLLTTRAQATGKLARRFEVETMDEEVGALLLLRRAGLVAQGATLDSASSADRVVAKALTRELDGLPLALDQAGAYIEETSCGLTGYQRLYQTRQRELLQARGGITDDHPEPVATTWSLSFEKVEQQNQASADLLRFCAFLAPDAIPEEMLTEGAKELGERLSPVAADPFLLNQAIESLRAYSLIRRDPEAQTLSVHRLVQAVVRESMFGKTQQQWMRRAIGTVNVAFPSIEFANWPVCERLLPHAIVSAVWIEQISEISLPAARLLNQAGIYLKVHARYEEAEPLYRQAITICEQQFGIGHFETAASLNNLAVLYKIQGKYTEAELAYRQALTICEQQLGTDHPNTAGALNNLAALYNEQGKYAEAEPLSRRALMICEQRLGVQHPKTAISLNTLAMLYDLQGKYAEAEPLYQRALAIQEQQLGANHHDTAQSLNNLATLYYHQGRFADAEPLYQRALHIWEQTLGLEHPNTRAVRSRYAALLRSTGRDAEAAKFEEEGNG